MTNKILSLVIFLFLFISNAESKIVFINNNVQNGYEYNTFIVHDAIRKVYGDSIFQLQLSETKSNVLAVFLTRNLEVESVRLLKKDNDCLRYDMDKWDEFVNYLKRQTFCFPMQGYNPKYSVTPTFFISVGRHGTPWNYIDFKNLYPEKRENMIDFHNYLSEHYRTYKFDLYEYNGKEWVMTKKDVVLYNH